MVGNFDRNNRHMKPRLVNKFMKLENEIPGFIDKIENPNTNGDPLADGELLFIDFPVSTKGNLVEDEDCTGLCRIFQEIKNNESNSLRGKYEYINATKFAEITRLEDTGSVPDDEAKQGSQTTKGKRSADFNPEKRPRVEELESDDGASGTTMVVEAIAQPFPVNIANESQPENTEEVQALHQAKDAEIQMLKAELEVRPTMDDILKLQAQINTKDTELKDLQKHNDGYVEDGFEAHCKMCDLEKTLKEAHTDNETLKSQVAELDAKVTDLESRPPAPAGPTDATLRIENLRVNAENEQLGSQLRAMTEKLRQADYVCNDLKEQVKMANMKPLEMHADREKFRMNMHEKEWKKSRK